MVVVGRDKRIFIYPDALLAIFFIEISITISKTASPKMALALGQPATTIFELSRSNHRSFNNNH